MTTFYVLNDDKKKQGTAVNAEKATEMLSLMFPGQKAFVVEDNKVPFAQNMTIGEAENVVGIKPTESVVELPVQTMEVLPETVTVESKVNIIAANPKNKTKVNSKVVVKKPVAKKKTKKPVAKKKTKKPVAKKAVKKPITKKKTTKKSVAKKVVKKPVKKK